MRLSVADLRVRKSVRREVPADVVRDRSEFRRRVGQADEDQSLDFHNVRRNQGEFRFVNRIGQVSRRPQRAVTPVGPGMVWADQLSERPAGVPADTRTAMPTDVEIRPDGAFVVPHENQRLVGDLIEKVIAQLTHTADMSGEQPMPEMDPLQIEFEDVSGCIKFAR